MSRRSLALALACLVGLALTVGVLASRSPKTPALARLTEVRGDAAERDYASSMNTWVGAQPGAEFRIGDGLRTDAKTHAKLHFIDASQLDVQPGTLLRFMLGGAEGAEELAIDVQTGMASLRTSGRDLRLRTHIGSFVVKAGTLVMLERDGDKLGFQVQLGSVQFRDAEGDLRNVGSGEEMKVAIGMAIMGGDEPPNMQRGALSLSVRGPGARLRKTADDAWQDLPEGAQPVAQGSELKLAAGGSATLQRGADRAELSGAGEFVLGGKDSLVTAKSGGVDAESVEEDVAVEVPGGVILLRKAGGGSKAKLRVGADEGSVSVERGKVSVVLNGTPQELATGDQRTWSISEGDAQITGEDDEGEGMPGLEAPTYFNLATTAGESFVLHTPSLPVSIALDFSAKCPEQGELRLSGSRLSSRGAGKINVLLNRGTRSYSVRCLGQSRRVVARGTIHVLLDAGTRKLPPLPPTSLADADGRTYTLYYSNQPPALRLRWPNPPKESSYVLEVDGKPQTLPSPEHVFKSGELSDGSHSVSFRAGTRRSRATTIEVRFDNNAPTASVTQPADRAFSPGQPLEVSGVSLPAWKVSLSGGTIREAAGGRFTGTVTPTAEQPDIAVRLSHPRRGVHYYLRRAASSP
jgi:hypothetical protein